MKRTHDIEKMHPMNLQDTNDSYSYLSSVAVPSLVEFLFNKVSSAISNSIACRALAKIKSFAAGRESSDLFFLKIESTLLFVSISIGVSPGLDIGNGPFAYVPVSGPEYLSIVPLGLRELVMLDLRESSLC